ncbi:hypothetical protein J2S40_004552 [Nocardioides luteus]|uniref:hypothetical protein n=1 Tax=Nocardioides luteus TaxID=1844 RepID=UPI001E533B75|nr:hypothetical protein [Nocardioides luteus]MDR7313494.1 hypothetical protein [Nocardioides luteus]
MPPPDGRLTLTVRLQTEAGAHVASVRGHRIATAPRLRMLLRAAPAALIGAGLVQAQRIALAIRRLPLRYRPLRGQVGAPRGVLG